MRNHRGTKAALSAPSASSRRKKLAICRTAKNASEGTPAPSDRDTDVARESEQARR